MPSTIRLHRPLIRATVGGMVDLKLEVPATESVEVDAGTLAAIDRGIKAADEGRTVSLDEVLKMIPKWISKFESQTRR